MESRVSIHFLRDEFRCKGKNCCGNVGPVSERLVAGLEKLRALVNQELRFGDVAMVVNSGFRCRKHNAEIGGDVDSYHMTGEAADIVVHGMSMLRLAKLARSVPEFEKGGIGVYESWIHVDVRRDGPCRW